jgi:uncharacterized protein involved in exopolysaccharide biosynthesis
MREDEFNLLRLWQSLLEERWIIAGITLLTAGVSIAISFSMTPIYRAEVTVAEVRNQQPGAGAFLGQLGGLAAIAGVDVDILRRNNGPARGILESRQLVEEYFRRNDLLPILFPDRWNESEGRWSDSAPPPSLWLGVEFFTKNILRIREETRTGLLILSCEWKDPQLAAKWANGLVELANEVLRQRDIRDAERNIAYVREQIDKITVLELRQVIYRLIESEMKTLMLANARREYAFTIIDPAIAPELRVRPRRSVIAILGTLVGGLLGLCVAGFRQTIKRERRRAAHETAGQS